MRGGSDGTLRVLNQRILRKKRGKEEREGRTQGESLALRRRRPKDNADDKEHCERPP